MDDFSLICPHCSRKVEIAEAILENIRGQYEKEEKRKHSEEIEAIKRQLAEKNELERVRLAAAVARRNNRRASQAVGIRKS